MSDYFVCPNCGSEVSLKAMACPDCGSDENTGWSQETLYDGLDLPELENETDTFPNTNISNKKYFVYIILIISFLTFLLIYFP